MKPIFNEIRRHSLCLIALTFLTGPSVEPLLAQPQRLPAVDPMLDLLEKRVAEDPTRADCWRLIGRIYQKQGRIEESSSAFLRALDLQADNAAAHFDYGELMLQLGDREAAWEHHQQVMTLAPESKYAAKLLERGFQRVAPMIAASIATTDSRSFDPTANDPLENSPSDVALTGYEIQTFDGAEDLDRRLNQITSDLTMPVKRWRTFVELGALYNTNVALTPVSRELAGEQGASAQAFLTPELEWIALNRGPWRSGPLMRGYFTLNEAEFDSLNLASFSPGAFLERDFGEFGATSWIARVDYVYSIDLLAGDRFGDRHAITTSLTTILPEADVIYSYLTTSLSDYADDGSDPAVDSLDGLAISAGISRFFQTGWSALPTWSVGADLESADTKGADYRYLAVNAHGDLTFQLTERLKFVPRAGVGYRSYGDFTGPVSRDELTYRISGKLRWQWTESLAISGVAGYDRFASENEDFDTERFETGVVLTFLR